MQEDDERVAELSEAQRLTLLNYERQLAIAIFEHAHARTLVADAKMALRKNEKLLRWIVISLLGVGAVYSTAVDIFPSISLSSTSTIIFAVLVGIMLNNFIQLQGKIGSRQDKGLYAEQLAEIKIDALVPGSVATVYDGFSIDEHITWESIVQKPAFRTLRSALIDEIILVTKPN